MTLYQKAKRVERLFVQLDKEIAAFSTNSGLSCLKGCGFCCTKPNVTATVLEFLPFAMHSFLNGYAEAAHQQLTDRTDKVCHIFKFSEPGTTQGFCSQYAERGMTCRLFGFSARKAKDEALQLYTCDLIKTQKAEDYQRSVAYVQQRKKVPVVSEFYQKLKNIDDYLASEMHPINVAQAKALELVLQYYSYRKPPRFKKVA